MGEYSSDTFNLSITNEKNVTAEDILAEADGIWKTLRDREYGQNEVDAIMQECRVAHKEFSKSYPIVLRYMVQFKSYSHKALKLYLAKIGRHPWKSEEEYLDSQADYAVLLYKNTNRKWNTSQMKNLWNNIRTSLKGETESFKKYHEEFTKEVTEDEKRLGDEFRAETIALLKRMTTRPSTVVEQPNKTTGSAWEFLAEWSRSLRCFDYSPFCKQRKSTLDDYATFVDEFDRNWLYLPDDVCKTMLLPEPVQLEGVSEQHAKCIADWFSSPIDGVTYGKFDGRLYVSFESANNCERWIDLPLHNFENESNLVQNNAISEIIDSFTEITTNNHLEKIQTDSSLTTQGVLSSPGQ